MIDERVLKLIKNNEYSTGTNFPEETHDLIHSFYEGFDLDRQDEEYRYHYIVNFIEQHEDFIVNFVTNIYNPNLKNTDKLSDELTFCKFIDTLSAYLTKYHGEQKA